MSWIQQQYNNVFEFLDNKIGPDRLKHKPACYETREMLMECVLESECFKKNENFNYCIKEGINKECKALRYEYGLCRRSQTFWEKSFCRDQKV